MSKNYLIYIIIILIFMHGIVYLFVVGLNKSYKEIISNKDEIIKGHEEVNTKSMEIINNNNKLLRTMNTVINDLDNAIENATMLISIGNFEATAYDLSVASTGKRKGDKGYGVTRSGKRIEGMTRNEARTIAVDKDLIPLGTWVYVRFRDKEYQHMNGMYKAEDTGSAIVGEIIDVYLGDFASEKEHPSVAKFGRRDVEIFVVMK